MTTKKLRKKVDNITAPFCNNEFTEAYFKVASHTEKGVDLNLLKTYSSVTDSFIYVASEIIGNASAIRNLITTSKPIAIYGFNARNHFMVNWLFHIDQRIIWNMPNNDTEFFQKVFIDLWHETLNSGDAMPFLERMERYDPYKAMLSNSSS